MVSYPVMYKPLLRFFSDLIMRIPFKVPEPLVFCLASSRDKKLSAKWKRRVNLSMRIRTNCTQKRQRQRKASPRKPKDKVRVRQGAGVGPVAGVVGVAVGRRIQVAKAPAQTPLTKLAHPRLERNLLRKVLQKKQKVSAEEPVTPKKPPSKRKKSNQSPKSPKVSEKAPDVCEVEDWYIYVGT